MEKCFRIFAFISRTFSQTVIDWFESIVISLAH